MFFTTAVTDVDIAASATRTLHDCRPDPWTDRFLRSPPLPDGRIWRVSTRKLPIWEDQGTNLTVSVPHHCQAWLIAVSRLFLAPRQLFIQLGRFWMLGFQSLQVVGGEFLGNVFAIHNLDQFDADFLAVLVADFDLAAIQF